MASSEVAPDETISVFTVIHMDISVYPFMVPMIDHIMFMYLRSSLCDPFVDGVLIGVQQLFSR